MLLGDMIRSCGLFLQGSSLRRTGRLFDVVESQPIELKGMGSTVLEIIDIEQFDFDVFSLLRQFERHHKVGIRHIVERGLSHRH